MRRLAFFFPLVLLSLFQVLCALPTPSTASNDPSFISLGCFVDVSTNHDLNGLAEAGLPCPFISSVMSEQICGQYCITLSFKYLGLQNGNSCYCGSQAPRYPQLSDSSCSVPCALNPSQMCGGINANSVLLTGVNLNSTTLEDLGSLLNGDTTLPNQSLNGDSGSIGGAAEAPGNFLSPSLTPSSPTPLATAAASSFNIQTVAGGFLGGAVIVALGFGTSLLLWYRRRRQVAQQKAREDEVRASLERKRTLLVRVGSQSPMAIPSPSLQMQGYANGGGGLITSVFPVRPLTSPSRGNGGNGRRVSQATWTASWIDPFQGSGMESLESLADDVDYSPNLVVRNPGNE